MILQRHASLLRPATPFRWSVALLWLMGWVAYEWAFFVHSETWGSQEIGTALKMISGLGLALAVMADSLRTKASFPIALHRYALCGLILFAWMVVPAAAYNAAEGWAKWAFRFATVLFTVLLVGRTPLLGATLRHLIAWSVLLMAILYFGTVIALYLGMVDVSITESSGAVLRLAATNMQLEGVTLVRFSGTFTEPAIAGGYAFAASSLWSNGSVGRKHSRFLASTICALAGICAMSITGYLVGLVLFGYRTSIAIPQHRGKILITALLAGFVVLGSRPLVAKLFPENMAMRAIVGIRTQSMDTIDDLSSGRVTTLGDSIDAGLTSIIGEGFPVVLGDGGREGLASSAPLLWLAFGGVPGLVLVILWQAQTIFNGKIWQPRSPGTVGAFLCLESLSTIYGTYLSIGLGAATGGFLADAALRRSTRCITPEGSGRSQQGLSGPERFA